MTTEDLYSQIADASLEELLELRINVFRGESFDDRTFPQWTKVAGSIRQLLRFYALEFLDLHLAVLKRTLELRGLMSPTLEREISRYLQIGGERAELEPKEEPKKRRSHKRREPKEKLVEVDLSEVPLL